MTREECFSLSLSSPLSQKKAPNDDDDDDNDEDFDGKNVAVHIASVGRWNMTEWVAKDDDVCKLLLKEESKKKKKKKKKNKMRVVYKHI